MWEEELRVRVERVGVGGARLRGLGLGCTTRILSTRRGRNTRRGRARGGCGTPVGGRAGRDS